MSNHVTSCTYEMQCSGRRGVSAMVHSGNSRCGGKASSEHSKQLVRRGRITRAWPLNPSVPPSMNGMIVVQSSLPESPSGSTRLTSIELSHRRASMLSRPEMITENSL